MTIPSGYTCTNPGIDLGMITTGWERLEGSTQTTRVEGIKTETIVFSEVPV